MPASKITDEIQVKTELAAPLKQNLVWYSILMETATMLLCVVGCVMLFSKGLSINISAYSIAIIIVSPLVFVLIYHSNRIKTVLIIGFLIFLGWSIYQHYDPLLLKTLDSLVLLNERFLTALNERSDANIVFFNPWISDEVRAIAENIIINSLALVLSMVFGLVVVRRKNPLIMGVIMVVFAFCGIYLSPKVPLLLLLVVLCGFVFYYIAWSMTADRTCKMVLSGRYIIMVQTMVVPVILAVSLVIGIYIPNNSTRNGKAYDMLSTIVDVINGKEISNFFGNKGMAQGGISGGKIGFVDNLEFSNQVHLTVKTNIQVPLFLRAMSGEQYISNDGWTQKLDHIKSEFVDLFKRMRLQDITPEMLSSKLGTTLLNGYGNGNAFPLTVELTNVAANEEYVYHPYNLFQAPSYGKVSNRVTENYNSFLYTIWMDGEQQFLQSFYDLPIQVRENIEKLVPESVGEIEEWYKRYAISSYTKVPDDISETITKFAQKAREKYETQQALNDDIDYDLAVTSVRQLLSETASYSLSPGSVPRGEEPIEYFLNENKKGYCAHFATAATLILREMGIPTRYVEGYVVTQNDYANAVANETDVVEIRDTNAHSWIEIYVVGPGWIPFEVTPGYSGYSVQAENIGSESDESSSEQVSSEEAVSSQEQVSSDTVSIPEQSSSESVSSEPIAAKINIGIVAGAIAIAIIAIFAIFVVAVFLRAAIILLRRKRRRATQGNNQAAIELFAYCTKLLAVKGYNMDEHGYAQAYAKFVEQDCYFVEKGMLQRVTEIVLKAKFSNHEITRGELETVVSLSKTLRTAIYFESNWYKRLILRYIKVV